MCKDDDEYIDLDRVVDDDEILRRDWKWLSLRCERRLVERLKFLKPKETQTPPPVNDASSSEFTCFVPRLLVTSPTLTRDPLEPGQVFSGDAALVFCDVSGFTSFAESIEQSGDAEAAATLGKCLNVFFDPLIRIINFWGGDVLKFSGDAVLAAWVVGGGGSSGGGGEETLDDGGGDALDGSEEDELKFAACIKACKCCLELHKMLNDYPIGFQEKRLSMHIGVGFGRLVTSHVGGLLGRWEFIVGGKPLQEIAIAEPIAKPGQTVISSSVYSIFQLARERRGFNFTSVEPSATYSNFYVLHLLDDDTSFDALQNSPTLGGSGAKPLLPSAALIAAVKKYMPSYIYARLQSGYSAFNNEMRRLCTVFVSIPGLDPSCPEGVLMAHKLVLQCQKAAYAIEGIVNKVLVDDKGALVLIFMGLPPVHHNDDPVRAVFVALKVASVVRRLGMEVGVGVASGSVWCGTLGNELRKEYTALGDSVNLAARLMSFAAQDPNHDVYIDEATYLQSRLVLEFIELDSVVAKGKGGKLKCFTPTGSLNLQAASAVNFKSPLETWPRWKIAQEIMRDLEHGKIKRGGLCVITGHPGCGCDDLHLILQRHLSYSLGWTCFSPVATSGATSGAGSSVGTSVAGTSGNFGGGTIGASREGGAASNGTRQGATTATGTSVASREGASREGGAASNGTRQGATTTSASGTTATGGGAAKFGQGPGRVSLDCAGAIDANHAWRLLCSGLVTKWSNSAARERLYCSGGGRCYGGDNLVKRRSLLDLVKELLDPSLHWRIGAIKGLIPGLQDARLDSLVRGCINVKCENSKICRGSSLESLYRLLGPSLNAGDGDECFTRLQTLNDFEKTLLEQDLCNERPGPFLASMIEGYANFDPVAIILNTRAGSLVSGGMDSSSWQIVWDIAKLACKRAKQLESVGASGGVGFRVGRFTRMAPVLLVVIGGGDGFKVPRKLSRLAAEFNACYTVPSLDRDEVADFVCHCLELGADESGAKGANESLGGATNFKGILKSTPVASKGVVEMGAVNNSDASNLGGGATNSRNSTSNSEETLKGAGDAKDVCGEATNLGATFSGNIPTTATRQGSAAINSATNSRNSEETLKGVGAASNLVASATSNLVANATAKQDPLAKLVDYLLQATCGMPSFIFKTLQHLQQLNRIHLEPLNYSDDKSATTDNTTTQRLASVQLDDAEEIELIAEITEYATSILEFLSPDELFVAKVASVLTHEFTRQQLLGPNPREFTDDKFNTLVDALVSRQLLQLVKERKNNVTCPRKYSISSIAIVKAIKHRILADELQWLNDTFNASIFDVQGTRLED